MNKFLRFLPVSRRICAVGQAKVREIPPGELLTEISQPQSVTDSGQELIFSFLSVVTRLHKCQKQEKRYITKHFLYQINRKLYKHYVNGEDAIIMDYSFCLQQFQLQYKIRAQLQLQQSEKIPELGLVDNTDKR